MKNWLRIAIFSLLLSHRAAFAIQPDEILPDAAMEQRARALGKELRCLVCQNQSIDDSDAELARDLRLLLRQRLMAGDTDAEARQYLVDRYGEYVLLKPPLSAATLALWGGPALLLLGGGVAVARFYRRRAMQEEITPSLSPEEHDKLREWGER